jgi:hypothetical protein
VGESFLAFWLLEAKIQNGEWIPFCQKFCIVFSSILQNDEPKPKIFWMKWGTKHTLSNISLILQVADLNGEQR